MAGLASSSLPIDRRDAISTSVAARIAGRSETTIKRWAEVHGIGRRVVGRWEVSRVGLAMLLANDREALTDFVAGDRSGSRVVAYFPILKHTG